VVGVGEPADPLGGGRERDAVPGLAGPDAQPGGQVCFPGAGRAEEHDVVFRGDEVEGAQVGDDLAFEGPLMVEVEVLQGFAAGNLAARMRPSPPWDSRAATSRCRQAARNSSCVHDSARVRSASRSTAPASDGAFSGRAG
jgi:hypothetical protein